MGITPVLLVHFLYCLNAFTLALMPMISMMPRWVGFCHLQKPTWFRKAIPNSPTNIAIFFQYCSKPDPLHPPSFWIFKLQVCSDRLLQKRINVSCDKNQQNQAKMCGNHIKYTLKVCLCQFYANYMSILRQKAFTNLQQYLYKGLTPTPTPPPFE